MEGLKLFVVGESSGDPAEWRTIYHRAIVAAHNPEEAAKLADLSTSMVHEITLREPTVLFIEVDDGARE